MADKTTKKAAPKATKAVKTEKVTLSLDEQLVAKRADLLEARKSLAAGELINPRVLTAARKDVARIMTKINQEKEGK